jgi:hypothetical protein
MTYSFHGDIVLQNIPGLPAVSVGSATIQSRVFQRGSGRKQFYRV